MDGEGRVGGWGGGSGSIFTVITNYLAPFCSTPPFRQDPDAPVRQHRHLSELDAKDELSLSKHLFACIRAGQLSKVI